MTKKKTVKKLPSGKVLTKKPKAKKEVQKVPLKKAVKNELSKPKKKEMMTMTVQEFTSHITRAAMDGANETLKTIMVLGSAPLFSSKGKPAAQEVKAPEGMQTRQEGMTSEEISESDF